jgi:hypothetical protein
VAELKSSEVKYSVPLVTKIGGVLFTATQIEFPASAETVVGGIELNLAKLGLTVESVLGDGTAAGPEGAVGEIASTSAVPLACWSSGWVLEQKTAGESATEIKIAIPVQVTLAGSKIKLRFLRSETAKKTFVEISTAEKANGAVGLSGCTIYCLGK